MPHKRDRKIVIVNDPNDSRWVDVVTPYDTDFVRSFKETIPSEDREYLPNHRIWRVHMPYVNDVKYLIKRHFPNDPVEVKLKQEQVEEIPKKDWPEGVIDACPDAQLERLLKALSLCFHPDVNPNVDQNYMKKINSAYQRRRRK